MKDYYTNIQPVDKKSPTVPSVEAQTLIGDVSKVKEYEETEITWMKKVLHVVRKDEVINKGSNISWAAFNAGNEVQKKKDIVHSQMLPVFTEASNTPAMVKHCLTVIIKAHAYTNPGEIPWVTADQPLYALFKTIQWRFPETHGEQLIVAVLGAMHTEKAAWTCVRQVEDGSGSSAIMAEADVTTFGVAESCRHCAHISRSRYLNTVSACVLYIMLRDSFQEYIDELPEGSQPIDIDKWCEDQKSPMFRFYLLLLNLKLLVLQFVRSVRTGNIEIYISQALRILRTSKKDDLQLPRRVSCSQTLALTTGKNKISKISNTMADHYLLRICQINFFYTLSQVQKLQTI